MAGFVILKSYCGDSNPGGREALRKCASGTFLAERAKGYARADKDAKRTGESPWRYHKANAMVIIVAFNGTEGRMP